MHEKYYQWFGWKNIISILDKLKEENNKLLFLLTLFNILKYYSSNIIK